MRASERYLVLEFGLNLNRLFVKLVVASLVNIANLSAMVMFVNCGLLHKVFCSVFLTIIHWFRLLANSSQISAKRKQGEVSIEKFFCKKSKSVDVEADIQEQNATAIEVASSSSPTEGPNQQIKTACTDILTEEMWENKTKCYPWLECASGKIGCKICSNVSNLGAMEAEGLKVSKEWSTTSVTFSGHSRSAQLTSVRKKCLIHAKSQFHVNVVNILESAINNSLPNAIYQLHKSEYVSTSKLFKSAYFLAKKDRPFSDHFDLLQLQDLKGADLILLLAK